MASPNHSARTAPDPADSQAFSGAPKFHVLSGPLKLYRFVGVLQDKITKRKHRCRVDGKWWFAQPVINELRQEFQQAALGGERVRNPAGTLLADIRDGLAVSYEWNNLDSIADLSVPPGQTIDAWVGMTQWQLAFQARPGSSILPGGLVQYLIYDAARLPTGWIEMQTMRTIWRQFSRQLGPAL